MEYLNFLDLIKYKGIHGNKYKIKECDDILYHLSLEKKLSIHNGCVNTVQWDSSGNYLLTGSDDRHLKITDPFRYEDENSTNDSYISSVLVNIPASDTILSAKFLPYPSDSIIVSGTRKGGVFVHHVNQFTSSSSSSSPPSMASASSPSSAPPSPSTGHHEANFMHDKCCVDVVTLPRQPHCFLSLSLDKKVCLFDIREDCASGTEGGGVTPQCYWTFRKPLTSAAVNPIRDWELALASSDGVVRILDMRAMNSAHDNSQIKTLAYCHPMGMRFCADMDASTLGHDFRFITGLNYCVDGSDVVLAASHMFRGIFIYNTHDNEISEDGQVDWDTSMWNNPTIQVQNNWENTGPLPILDNNPITRSFLRFTSTLRIQEVMRRSFTEAMDDVTQSELKDVKRYKQIGHLQGHRNAHTVIKDPVFWGSKYLMSGSECGHVFVWDWRAQKLVQIMLADERVVNRVRPHPEMPILATCGLGYYAKLWSPRFMKTLEVKSDPDDLNQVIARNASMTHEGINLRLGEFVQLLLTLSQSSRQQRRQENE